TPISIITDVDVKPLVYYEVEDIEKNIYRIENDNELDDVLAYCDEKKDNLHIESIGNYYSSLKSLARGFGFKLNDSNNNDIKNIVTKSITDKTITEKKEQKKSKINADRKSTRLNSSHVSIS